MPQLAPERLIELRRITYFQVAKVDVVEQIFKCHVYIECAIPGGAKDEPLAGKENRMTNGHEYKDGPHAGKKWPVIPSAMWYLENQFNFANAVELDVKECKVLTAKEDLVLIKRVMGEFMVLMDLHQFPMDVQKLTMSIEIQCAANGPFPVTIAKNCSGNAMVMEKNFMPIASWELLPGMEVEATETLLDMGPQNSKIYPTFKFGPRIARKSGFYIINIVSPIACFSLMSIAIPWGMTQDMNEGRLSVTLALLITAAAYKFAIGSFMPPIAYMTIIDKYVMTASILLLLCALQNCVVGVVQSDGKGHGEMSLLFHPDVDLYTNIALMGLWLVIHIYYIHRMLVAAYGRKKDVNEYKIQRQKSMRRGMRRSDSSKGSLVGLLRGFGTSRDLGSPKAKGDSEGLLTPSPPPLAA